MLRDTLRSQVPMWRALQEVGPNSQPPKTDPKGLDFNTVISDTNNTEKGLYRHLLNSAIPFNSNAY